MLYSITVLLPKGSGGNDKSVFGMASLRCIEGGLFFGVYSLQLAV